MLEAIFNNEWKLVFVVGLLSLGSAEAGFWAGRKLHLTKDEARRSQIGGVQAATFGLLGLLLGFTFSMAVGRYEARRSLVLKEANAIGTTWLRAELLSDAHRAAVEELLRRYVHVRLEYQALVRDPAKATEGLLLSSEIENQLWWHAKDAAKEAPTPLTVSFITALNEMIDTDAERVAAARNQIPTGVWMLLALVAGFGSFTSGYGSGACGTRSAFTSFLLPGMIIVVIMLIFDLSHSQQGIIGISQQPLIDLQQSMQTGAP